MVSTNISLQPLPKYPAVIARSACDIRSSDHQRRGVPPPQQPTFFQLSIPGSWHGSRFRQLGRLGLDRCLRGQSRPSPWHCWRRLPRTFASAPTASAATTTTSSSSSPSKPSGGISSAVLGSKPNSTSGLSSQPQREQ